MSAPARDAMSPARPLSLVSLDAYRPAPRPVRLAAIGVCFVLGLCAWMAFVGWLVR